MKKGIGDERVVRAHKNELKVSFTKLVVIEQVAIHLEGQRFSRIWHPMRRVFDVYCKRVRVKEMAIEPMNSK